MKHVFPLAIALAGFSAVAASDQRSMSFQVGETWQVVANAPAGWLSRGFKVAKVAAYPQSTDELFSYVDLFDTSAAAFFDERTQKSAIVWNQSTKDFPDKVMYACISPRQSKRVTEWTGTLLLNFDTNLGVCQAKKSAEAIAMPKNLPPNPLGISNPFQNKQIWKIDVQGKIKGSKKFEIIDLDERSIQGFFRSTGSAVGFNFYKSRKTVEITVDFKEGLLICEIVNVTDAGKTFRGHAYLRTSEKTGDCTLNRLK